MSDRVKQLVGLGDELLLGGFVSEAEFCFSKAIDLCAIAGMECSSVRADAGDRLKDIFVGLHRFEDVDFI